MKRFADLTTREKRLLLGGGGVLCALALWLYVWQPLSEQRLVQQDRIARYAAILDTVEGAPEDSARVTSECSGPRSLAPRVVESAEDAGIPLARLDPQGAVLRVTVAETDYARAITWISALETRACLRATGVEMSRLTAPGQVSLRLTLEAAGS